MAASAPAKLPYGLSPVRKWANGDMSSSPSGKADGQEEEAGPGGGDGPPGSRREAGNREYISLQQGEGVRLNHTPGPAHAVLPCPACFNSRVLHASLHVAEERVRWQWLREEDISHRD